MLNTRTRRITTTLALALLPTLLIGCNAAQSGALIGSGIGAAAGAGIDHRDRGRGALIGAGIGAVTGYIFGNEYDKGVQQQRYYNTGYSNTAYRRTDYYPTSSVRVYEHHYYSRPHYTRYHHHHHHHYECYPNGW